MADSDLGLVTCGLHGAHTVHGALGANRAPRAHTAQKAHRAHVAHRALAAHEAPWAHRGHWAHRARTGREAAGGSSTAETRGDGSPLAPVTGSRPHLTLPHAVDPKQERASGGRSSSRHHKGRHGATSAITVGLIPRRLQKLGRSPRASSTSRAKQGTTRGRRGHISGHPTYTPDAGLARQSRTTRDGQKATPIPPLPSAEARGCWREQPTEPTATQCQTTGYKAPAALP